jgi:hypothetical protein
MTQEKTGDVTGLLGRFRHGDRSVEELLLPLVCHELHRLAARYMQYERRDHTLQPTAHVDEAYVRLVDSARCHRCGLTKLAKMRECLAIELRRWSS